jgi:hypothetical protein
VDGVATLLEQHVAEEPSLFGRQATNKPVEDGTISRFEEVATPGNHLLRDRMGRLVDQLINKGFVGVNRSR